jgi:hypothetical protein
LASSVGWRSTWLLAVGLVACSDAAALQGPGGRCFLVSDCKPGFVCVTQADNSRRCSGDLSGIVSTEGADAASRPPMRDSGPPAEAAVAPSGDDASGEAPPDGTEDAQAPE